MGARFIDHIPSDQKAEFPEVRCFSPWSLKYTRPFAEAWAEPKFVQQVAAQIPWFCNCVIPDKIQDWEVWGWYARKTITNGCSHKTCSCTRLGAVSMDVKNAVNDNPCLYFPCSPAQLIPDFLDII